MDYHYAYSQIYLSEQVIENLYELVESMSDEPKSQDRAILLDALFEIARLFDWEEEKVCSLN